MIQESRTKYYYPGLARKIRAWVINCPDCIANKRIDTRQIRPKMLSNTEFTFGPEDCLEVDILPNLPSSNGYTMMDNNDGRFLSIPLRIPYARHDSQNSRPMHNRRNDTPLLPAYNNPHQQRITIPVRCRKSDSANS